MANQLIDQTTQQDLLRPLRQFIGALAGNDSDQTWAGEDGYAINLPGGFQIIGPQGGVSIEGRPVTVAPDDRQPVAGGPPNGGLLILAGLAALILF